MADCLMYGMKRQRIDANGAHKIYFEAAKLHQPEAMSTYAAIVYQSMLMPERKYAILLPFDSVPTNKIRSLNKADIEKMWYFLDRVATMNWISPFLVFQAKQAEHLVIWSLSEIVKDAMERRETGEKLNLQCIVSKPCSHNLCDIRIQVASFAVMCNRCLKLNYCSNRCDY